MQQGPEFSLSPYNPSGDGSLQPAKRRALTTGSEKNPVRYETLAIISLTREEAQQVLTWAANAARAIDVVGQALTVLPGETRRSLEEDQTGTTRQEGQVQSNTQESRKTRGFAFIFFSESTHTSRSTMANSRVTTETEQHISGEDVSRTRPGPFLNGAQLQAALEGVAIARQEGVLLLPAAQNELNRRQGAMTGITRRLLLDHGATNLSWSEDIQEGTINGLIQQLQQVVEQMQNGYLTRDIAAEIPSDKRETIDETLAGELEENLNTAFADLIQFSLIRGRGSVIERAAQTLEWCVTEGIYSIDPQRAIKLLKIWLDVFSNNGNDKESAEIIGHAFTNTLCKNILRAQDASEDDQLFSDFADIAANTARLGGTKFLLESFIEQAKKVQPNAKTTFIFLQMARAEKRQPENPESEKILITLIRFSLFTDQEKEVVLGLLEQLFDKKEERLNLTKGRWKLPLDMLNHLINNLTDEEWRKVKEFLGEDENEEHWQVRYGSDSLSFRNDSSYNQSFPDSIQELRDPEIIAVCQEFFRDKVRAVIQYLNTKLAPSGRLPYMYSQCEDSVRRELAGELHQQIETVREAAVNFTKSHSAELLQLANDEPLVSKVEGHSSYWTHLIPDEKICKPLEMICSPQFSILDAKEQLGIIQAFFSRVASYRRYANYEASSANPLRRRKFARISSHLTVEEIEGVETTSLSLVDLTSALPNYKADLLLG